MNLPLHQLFIPVLIVAYLLTGCDDEQTSQVAFFDHYQQYCGYAYKGETTYLDLADDSFDGAALTMILESCTETEVRIPFIVDEDSSRTWIVQMTDDGLHLSHDHRYPDGTEYDQNFYGGYADDEGTEFLQYFPADERTIEERPQREINRWAKEFDLENERYYYRLYLRDELRFEAEFDLSAPAAL